MRRVSVVGSGGSGKTTVARRLAGRLGIPTIELDELHWGPDWTPVDDVVFRERVRAAVSVDAWVCDGNYSAVRPIVLERADTVVWLDLPLWTCVARVLSRSARRIRSGERLWHGNRETWWNTILSRDALIWWVISQHWRKKREYEARFRALGLAHLRVVRLRSPGAVEEWFAQLG